jgi:hypothetical protein
MRVQIKQFFINIIMNFVVLDRYGLFLRTPRLSDLLIVVLIVLSLVFPSVDNGKLNVESGLFPFLSNFYFHFLVFLRDH